MTTDNRLKLAIVYDPTLPKFTKQSYSSTYADMLWRIERRFQITPPVTQSCSAEDIEADVILIYDIHSSHHIRIDGLAKHKAVKYTYFNDPHQRAMTLKYPDGRRVYKMNARQRVERAIERGVDHIICPYKNGYYKYIAPELISQGQKPDSMLFWFPPCPTIERFPERLRTIPLAERRHKILGNGMLRTNNLSIYDFRKWAFRQPNTFYVKHAMDKPTVPCGVAYVKLLCQFAGALALCDWHVVPKYQEIPLAGCVCFAQDNEDYRDMGFVHGRNCYFINSKPEFTSITSAFLAANSGELYASDMSDYQALADAGRKLIEDKWTAEHFADAFYNHALQRVRPNSKERT